MSVCTHELCVVFNTQPHRQVQPMLMLIVQPCSILDSQAISFCYCGRGLSILFYSRVLSCRDGRFSKVRPRY